MIDPDDSDPGEPSPAEGAKKPQPSRMSHREMLDVLGVMARQLVDEVVRLSLHDPLSRDAVSGAHEHDHGCEVLSTRVGGAVSVAQLSEPFAGQVQ